MKYTILGLVFVLILSFWTVKPLFNENYFPMHDDTQVGRVVSMGKALAQGQFPVRWVADLGFGFGYPLYNFYGPLPYYVGGFLYTMGIDGLNATKTVFLLGIMLASITMYLTVASFFGITIGVVASVLYAYFPYHAVQVYVRGALGEYWVLVFLPIFMWSILSVYLKKYGNKPIYAGILSLFGVIVSHTILGYTLTLFFIITAVAVLLIRSVKKIKSLYVIVGFGKILVGALGLSAFFWLPAIVEMDFTNVSGQIGSTANFRDHFVCLNQLWNSLWGFGGSQFGCIDGFSFKLGKLNMILGVVGFIILVFNRSIIPEKRKILLVSLFIAASSIFLATQGSQLIWEVLPRMEYVQYPWRFLTFTVYGLSILAVTSLVIVASHKKRILMALLIVVVTLYTNGKLFNPQYLYSKDSSAFETPEELQFRVSKVSHEYLPKYFQLPSTFDMIKHGTIPISTYYTVRVVSEDTLYGKYEIEVHNPISLTINKAYFPSWRYFVDGQPHMPEIKNGLPTFLLSAGVHTLTIQWKDTRVESLGNLITIFTAVSIIFFYVKQKKKIIS